MARRPDGWIAPGPQPRGPDGRAELAPAADEDLSYLSGDWRLFQKREGHRWSLDDLVTAWVATRDLPATFASLALDLGCGAASVLLMVAWRLPLVDVTGIEAQADRAALGRRSIAYNGVAERCRIVDGDLRDHGFEARFALITGTPPYFPRGTGTESDKPHAMPCRFELRGGVEDYLAAAARMIAPGGSITICTSSLERERVRDAAAAAALPWREHWQIIPREGKPALVDVDVFGPATAPPQQHTLTVRDRAGHWTPEFRTVRDQMGMPSTPPSRSSG
ncbi:MAG: methyltransferase [Kofleriaceae bacterium]